MLVTSSLTVTVEMRTERVTKCGVFLLVFFEIL